MGGPNSLGGGAGADCALFGLLLDLLHQVSASRAVVDAMDGTKWTGLTNGRRVLQGKKFNLPV